MEPHQQPTRDYSRSTPKHRIIPTIETREILAERFPKVYPWMILAAEVDGLRPVEIQLLGSVFIVPLRDLDPVSWKCCS